ncbi:hypothetical protein [Haloechinothrix sp. LS1_15]|uniref:hypothetical protein n=1 Tax=Haloechinothrix sp. LS1_15 TaxID=2652248 RepID=UPI002946FAAD|nr:hypothetical protein [Haloechinothrix sp. LS1_15]MDV6014758.1 hypothetical protein [Haloechinothrix sp. LS1_15]
MSDKFESGDVEFRVSPEDEDYSIRIVEFTELKILNEEAESNGFSAKWQSVDTLESQVLPDSRCILSPVFRNRGGSGSIRYYRCHIWFVSGASRNGCVSLMDVAPGTLYSLREVNDTHELKRVVRVLLGNYPLSRIF